MSNTYYGITIPGSKGSRDAVTKASSTTGANFELVVLDGVSGNSRTEMLKALHAVAEFITKEDAPA